ncbi:MAG TPA: EAL domain-containing protein [Aliidongia sp.]|nr:EAL domain-containing protein [Aliidongia sp.]
MNRQARTEASSDQEYRLVDCIDRLNRYREGRRAVHIHLSRLKSQNRRDHHLRIAANTFENLTQLFEGQLFKLANHDIFFVFRNANPADIDEAVIRLRYLFNDDPLIHEADDEIPDGFCTWYDVERQFAELQAVAKALYEEAQKRQKRLAMIAGDGRDDKPPIDPHRLGELVDTIASADLSNLMRRQAVYAIVGVQAPQTLFRELFISIAELQKQILPNYNILADRWLFQSLTETLDRRMLSMLAKNDDPMIGSSFSVNLNISTILSPEFLQYDASLRSAARGTIVVELQMIDVYADIAAFTFARDFLRDRGYRICLDGLTELTIGHIDRERLGVDLVKLQWSPSLAEDHSEPRRQKVKEIIDRIGKARTILCHVDSEVAIKFGHSIGIPMYQGRFLDQLMGAKNVPYRPR